MIKKNWKTLLVASVVLLLPILAGIILWNQLPEQMPTHWNADGEVDSWSSKPFAVFGLPLLMLAIYWVCVLGTSADTVYGELELNAEKEQLKEALKKLSERERKIMFLRFGLGGGEEMTQKDVADLLGISQSYISRLEKKIILRLKKEIAKME